MADRNKINDTLGRYAYGYDENEIDAIEAAFTKNAVMTMKIADGDLIGPFEGREAILKLMTDSLEQQTDQRRHVCSNVWVADETDDSATVTSYLTLIAVADGELDVLSSGYYRDKFVKEGDNWVIADRFLQLDRPY